MQEQSPCSFYVETGVAANEAAWKILSSGEERGRSGAGIMVTEADTTNRSVDYGQCLTVMGM